MLDARPSLRILVLLAGWLATAPSRPAEAESAAVPYVTLSDITVNEGQAGMTPFSAEVRLFWPTALAMDVAAHADTATGADFTFATTRLTLAPGEVKTVSGFIVGDRIFEGNEAFDLRATLASGASFATVLVSNGGRVTIQDDDDDIAGRIRVADVNLPEGNGGSIKHEIKLTLQPASATTVSVDYATMDMSAMAGADYEAAMGSITFAPGEVEKTIELSTLGDGRWEIPGKFALVFSHARGALLERNQALITIENDDPPLVVAAEDVTIDEGTGGIKTVPITFHWAGPGAPTKILVGIVAGSARPSDADAGNGGFRTLTPRLDDRSAVYRLVIVSDARPECDEGIVLQYATNDTGDVSPKTVKVLVHDDDSGPTGAACPDPFGPTPVMADADLLPSLGPDDAVPGEPSPDAGVHPDAGVPADSAPADASIADAAAPGIPSAPPRGDDRGGSCSIGGGGPGLPAILSSAAAVMLVARRRRRR
jgi:hypothetical protein